MNTAIVPGSLAALASKANQSLAESFLNVEAIVIVDVSGSMHTLDAPGNKSRYDAACAELESLQRAYPGKIGIVAFSDTAQFVPGGKPMMQGGGTNMVAALDTVKCADGLGIKLILISDGQPDSPEETIARASRFKTHIDTVYIGSERESSGREFLQRLAKATGGNFAKSAAPAMLQQPVIALLNAA